jgi:hypothetical protein
MQLKEGKTKLMLVKQSFYGGFTEFHSNLTEWNFFYGAVTEGDPDFVDARSLKVKVDASKVKIKVKR